MIKSGNEVNLLHGPVALGDGGVDMTLGRVVGPPLWSQLPAEGRGGWSHARTTPGHLFLTHSLTSVGTAACVDAGVVSGSCATDAACACTSALADSMCAGKRISNCKYRRNPRACQPEVVGDVSVV